MKKAIVSAILIGFVVGSFSFFIADLIVEKYTINNDTIFRTNFLIQNLRGDTIDTWISWKIIEGDLFHIHAVDSPFITEERSNAILDVIMSSEEIEIDDLLLHKGPSGTSSTYFVGWYGALNSIDSGTVSQMPKKLHFHVTDKGEGNILINLSNLSNPDGYSGYTKSIVDETEHQILKSTITIYDIDRISIKQLKIILRHELGHGIGLAHSTDPEDLMAPTISTNYPYISECDLAAVSHLYNGGQTSQVVCEK